MDDIVVIISAFPMHFSTCSIILYIYLRVIITGEQRQDFVIHHFDACSGNVIENKSEDTAFADN